MPLVESGRQQRAFHPSRIWLFLVLCFIRPETYGLGLGELTDPTVVGQPLHTKIKILDAPFPLETIRATLIPPDEAQALGFDFLPLPYDVAVEVKDFQREPYLFLTTKEPVFEPYLEFLLQLKWPKGQMYREIVILPSSPTKKSSKFVGEKNQQAALDAVPLLRSGVPLTLPQKHIIQEGDILSVLAVKWGRATRQSSRALTRDVTRWLIENNPHSFVQGNVKKLRVGATLVFPTLEQMGLDNPQDITQRQLAVKHDTSSVETFSYTQPEKGIPYDFIRDFTVAPTSSDRKQAGTALTPQDAELLAQFEKSVKNAQLQLSQLEQAAEGQIHRLEKLEQHAFDPLAIEKQLAEMMKWQQTEASQMKELFKLLQLMQKSLIERTNVERSNVDRSEHDKSTLDFNVSENPTSIDLGSVSNKMPALTQTPSIAIGDGVAFWIKALAFFFLGMLGGLVGMLLANKLDRKGWLKTPRWSTTLWAAPWLSKQDRKFLLTFKFFKSIQSFSLFKKLSRKSKPSTASSKPTAQKSRWFRWQVPLNWNTWGRRWREKLALLKLNGIKVFHFEALKKQFQSKSERKSLKDKIAKNKALKNKGSKEAKNKIEPQIKDREPFLNPKKRRHMQDLPTQEPQKKNTKVVEPTKEQEKQQTEKSPEPLQTTSPIDYRQGGRRGARAQRGAAYATPPVEKPVEEKAIKEKPVEEKIVEEKIVEEKRIEPGPEQQAKPQNPENNVQQETQVEVKQEKRQQKTSLIEPEIEKIPVEQTVQNDKVASEETVIIQNDHGENQEEDIRQEVQEIHSEGDLNMPLSSKDEVKDLVEQEVLDYSLSEPEDLPDLPLNNDESLKPLDEAFDTAVTTTNDFASSLYPINEASLPDKDEFPDVCAELKDFATRHHINSDELKDIVEGEGTIEICAVPTSYNIEDAKESFFSSGKARNYDEAMKQISPESDIDLSHLSLEERPDDSGK